jgi:hypothetical protein
MSSPAPHEPPSGQSAAERQTATGASQAALPIGDRADSRRQAHTVADAPPQELVVGASLTLKDE